MARVPVVGQHPGIMNFLLVAGLVSAARAFAAASTFTAACETLAVQLEAAYFGAPAPMMPLARLLLHPLLHQLLNFGAGLGIGTLVIAMEEAVEQVVAEATGLQTALDLEVGQVFGVGAAGVHLLHHNNYDPTSRVRIQELLAWPGLEILPGAVPELSYIGRQGKKVFGPLQPLLNAYLEGGDAKYLETTGMQIILIPALILQQVSGRLGPIGSLVSRSMPDCIAVVHIFDCIRLCVSQVNQGTGYKLGYCGWFD